MVGDHRDRIAHDVMARAAPEAYESEVLAAHNMLNSDRRVHHSTPRFRHKQGHTMWVERQCTLARDACYRPLFFICEIVAARLAPGYASTLEQQLGECADPSAPADRDSPLDDERRAERGTGRQPESEEMVA